MPTNRNIRDGLTPYNYLFDAFNYVDNPNYWSDTSSEPCQKKPRLDEQEEGGEEEEEEEEDTDDDDDTDVTVHMKPPTDDTDMFQNTSEPLYPFNINHRLPVNLETANKFNQSIDYVTEQTYTFQHPMYYYENHNQNVHCPNPQFITYHIETAVPTTITGFDNELITPQLPSASSFDTESTSHFFFYKPDYTKINENMMTATTTITFNQPPQNPFEIKIDIEGFKPHYEKNVTEPEFGEQPTSDIWNKPYWDTSMTIASNGTVLTDEDSPLLLKCGPHLFNTRRKIVTVFAKQKLHVQNMVEAQLLQHFDSAGYLQMSSHPQLGFWGPNNKYVITDLELIEPQEVQLSTPSAYANNRYSVDIPVDHFATIKIYSEGEITGYDTNVVDSYNETNAEVQLAEKTYDEGKVILLAQSPNTLYPTYNEPYTLP